MKTTHLKRVLICLALLMSVVFFGCARQSMTGDMDNGMGTATERPMQAETMNKSMDEMNSTTATDGMSTMQDETMTPAKDEMMK